MEESDSIEAEETSSEDQQAGESGDQPKTKEPTYKELQAQVAVLARMLQCYVDKRDSFDITGGMARSLLKNVPEAAEEMIRKNRHMAYTLRQVKQGFHSLIAAQVLPNEGWDAAAQKLIDYVNDAIEATNDEVRRELEDR